MLDLYQYFKASLADHEYVKAVYRCTGITRMEEMIRNVATTKFPCIMVDIGIDGYFDMLTGDNCTTSQTFYLLENPKAGDVDAIAEVMTRTRGEGKRLIRQMRSVGIDYGDQCFGIDFSRVDFIRIGPIGLGAYGYGFILNIVEQ